MVGALHLRFGWVSFIVLLMSVSSPGTSLVRAQSSRLYVELAPTRGATALSSYIDAQANYVAAAGSFLESASIARNHNAAAAEHEMRNSVLWVQTYFRKRELNREYRRREKTSRRDKIANRYEVAERRILEQSFDLIKEDPTQRLNWMLDALASTAIGRFMDESAETYYEGIDEPLSESDVKHISITESSGKDGRRLTFRASDGKVLVPRWPHVLNNPIFEQEREHFEGTCDHIFRTMREEGALSWDAARELRGAVDKIQDAFQKHYGGPRYSNGWYLRMNSYGDYLAGKRYIENLAASVGRLILLDDVSAIEISSRFEGGSVIDLIHFMCRRGLQFAKPQPGDEPTYRNLFFAMRHIYDQVLSLGEITKPSKSQPTQSPLPPTLP